MQEDDADATMCASGGGRANWNATANQPGAIASVASVSFNFRTMTDVRGCRIVAIVKIIFNYFDLIFCRYSRGNIVNYKSHTVSKF